MELNEVEKINIFNRYFFIIIIILYSLILIFSIIIFRKFFILENIFYIYYTILFILMIVLIILNLVYLQIKTGTLEIHNNYIQLPRIIIKYKNPFRMKKVIKNYKLFFNEIYLIKINGGDAFIETVNGFSFHVPLIFLPNIFFNNRYIKRNVKISGNRNNVMSKIGIFIFEKLIFIYRIWPYSEFR